AFAGWRDQPPLACARIMFRFKQLLDERRDDLAALITGEPGKTFDDARGEVTRAIEVVEYACIAGEPTPRLRSRAARGTPRAAVRAGGTGNLARTRCPSE